MCAQVTKVSPLAPDGGFPDLPVIDGVRFAHASAGVRYKGRADVMLAELAPGSVIAGTFTRSATRAAPVLDCQGKIGAGHGEGASGAAFLVNSGNANAFTGAAGDASVGTICDAVAKALDIPAERVFTASTGVIGEKLPDDRIVAALEGLGHGLSPDGAAGAARAIMTTDTFAKGAGRVVATSAGPVRIAGFAKGSGMIAPDMATMLVFVFTDAAIGRPPLQQLTGRICAETFNRITVDSDTSTSDTLLVAATGRSGVAIDAAGPADKAAFASGLHEVMEDLAKQVVRDGEGATKFVTVRVTSAATTEDADLVARSIANSPLVKTAIAGEDPNWGRIVMAVGKSGATADRDRLSISFGDIEVARDGWVSASYHEAEGAAYMKRPEIEITVDLGVGEAAGWMWTCDLTHDYIAINADYRS